MLDPPQAFGSQGLRHGATPASSAAIILSVSSWSWSRLCVEWLRRFRIWLLLGTELFLKQPPHPRIAAGGARARQRAGRDQRSGSTGRTLAAAGAYARS